MYSDILSSDTSEGLENINDLPFLLDPETGDISLNFDPQKGLKKFKYLCCFSNQDKAPMNQICS